MPISSQIWKAAVCSNRATVYINMKNYSSAKQDCDLALGFDSKYINAIQKRGKALIVGCFIFGYYSIFNVVKTL